jgi:hypothetical protein
MQTSGACQLLIRCWTVCQQLSANLAGGSFVNWCNMVLMNGLNLQGDNSSGAGAALLHLARIRNKSSAHILAAAVSPDGTRVAYSDAQHLRVFDVTCQQPAAPGDGIAEGRQQVKVRRRPLPDGTKPAHQLHFAPDGRLLASAADGRLSVLDLDAEAMLLASFDQPKSSGAGSGASAVVAGAGGHRSSTAREQLQSAAAALAATGSGGGWAAAAAGSQVGQHHRGRAGGVTA